MVVHMYSAMVHTHPSIITTAMVVHMYSAMVVLSYGHTDDSAIPVDVHSRLITTDYSLL